MNLKDLPVYPVTDPLPLNEGETALCPLFDPGLAHAQALGLDPAAPGAFHRHNGWHLLLGWDRRQAGARVLTLGCRCAVELHGADRLFLHGSFPAGLRLRLTARIDGRTQEVFAATSSGEEDEWEGPLAGSRLEGFEFEIGSERTVPDREESWILLVGLADSARRERWLTRRAPAGWHGGLVAAGAAGELKPHVGVWFEAGDLPRWRELAASPTFAPLMEMLRQEAAACRADFVPEAMLQVGLVRGRIPHHMYTRPRDWPYWRGLVMGARLNSFVGLLDGNSDILRFGARCGLALAAHPVWSNWFDRLHGRQPPNHALFESAATAAAVQTLDWAGAVLTPLGRTQLWDSIFRNGLAQLLRVQAFSDWVYTSNHGLYNLTGITQAALALARSTRHGAWLLPACEAMLKETVAANYLPDGSTRESPGYWGANLANLGILIPLARHRGLSVPDYLRQHEYPEAILRLGDVYRVHLAGGESAPPGAYLPTGDSGWEAPVPTLRPEALPILSALTGDPELADLPIQALQDGKPDRYEAMSIGPQIFFCAAAMKPPSAAPGRRARPPAFAILPHGGMLCSCRPSPLGMVRWQLLGAPAKATHSHEDVGSILLEVDGELLLVDPGITSYHNPRVGLFKEAERHNQLVPLDSAGSPMRQVQPPAAACIPAGSGDTGRLEATLDSSAAWPAPVSSVRRRLSSGGPLHLEIRDSLTASGQGLGALLIFQSLYPISTTGPTAASVGGPRCRLRLEFTPQPVELRIDHDFADHAGRPVWRLSARYPPAIAHEVCSRLRLTPTTDKDASTLSNPRN